MQINSKHIKALTAANPHTHARTLCHSAMRHYFQAIRQPADQPTDCFNYSNRANETQSKAVPFFHGQFHFSIGLQQSTLPGAGSIRPHTKGDTGRPNRKAAAAAATAAAYSQRASCTAKFD